MFVRCKERFESRRTRRYWCIGPTDPRALNTFIERPAIQARLLYWLTALHAVNGMLYYDVAIWSAQCPASAKGGKGRPCKPVGRINNTALTDFDPATFPDPSRASPELLLCRRAHR